MSDIYESAACNCTLKTATAFRKSFKGCEQVCYFELSMLRLPFQGSDLPVPRIICQVVSVLPRHLSAFYKGDLGLNAAALVQVPLPYYY